MPLPCDAAVKLNPQRVLVLGATGHFGGRIMRALKRAPGVEPIAAARRAAGLQKLADELALAPHCIAQVDAFDADLAARLRELDAGVVIHTVGPFQTQSYDVARRCIEAGAHYIDLADGRRFVTDFASAMQSAAEAAGVLAVSGASTLPALSSAVIDHYHNDFDSLDEIDVVIAPAQKTVQGKATLGAVLSYCGRPFPWLQDGRWVDAYGWQSLRKTSMPKLGARWAAACDVPDLALLPQRYPGVRTVQFRAALELGIQHGALWAMAGLRRMLPIFPVESFAGVMGQAARLLDHFGSERGGMTVTMRGTRHGARKTLVWYIVAEQNQGPEIPCLAAELIACQLARGEQKARGATPCMGLLTLDDFLTAFKAWPFECGILDDAA